MKWPCLRSAPGISQELSASHSIAASTVMPDLQPIIIGMARRHRVGQVTKRKAKPKKRGSPAGLHTLQLCANVRACHLQKLGMSASDPVASCPDRQSHRQEKIPSRILHRPSSPELQSTPPRAWISHDPLLPITRLTHPGAREAPCAIKAAPRDRHRACGRRSHRRWESLPCLATGDYGFFGAGDR